MPSIWIASRSRSSSRVSIHAFMRAADNATKRREVAGFDSLAPSNTGTSPSGNRTERLKRKRRDVDQHLVDRPFAEQVFADGALPTRQRALGPVEPANPWALDLDLAARESRSCLWSAPSAAPLAPLTPLVALATGRRRILF